MGVLVEFQNEQLNPFSRIEVCAPGESGIAFALDEMNRFIYRYIDSANYEELGRRLEVRKRFSEKEYFSGMVKSEVYGPAINYDRPIGDPKNVVGVVNFGSRVVFVSNGDVIQSHEERCGIWVKMISSRGLERFGELIPRKNTVVQNVLG